ncbi:hypothetical protein C8Q76DRAFT_690527 [Earliella scabrosa]|nr:hypothetical protein C8Q76DRAFT_690527 [Earliella scabrosa]
MNQLPPKPLLPPCNGSHATPWGAEGGDVIPAYLFMCRCELANCVPPEYKEEADISDDSWEWACTWAGCEHTFDFSAITEWAMNWMAECAQTDKANLHPECIVAWAGVTLERLVRRHYLRHLGENGIEVVEISGVHYTCWATPELAIERRRAFGFPTRVPGEVDEVTAQGQGAGELAEGEDDGEAAEGA